MFLSLEKFISKFLSDFLFGHKQQHPPPPKKNHKNRNKSFKISLLVKFLIFFFPFFFFCQFFKEGIFFIHELILNFPCVQKKPKNVTKNIKLKKKRKRMFIIYGFKLNYFGKAYIRNVSGEIHFSV